jgi:WD40 repeat protein
MLQPAVTKRYTISGHKDSVYTMERGPLPGIFYSSGADGLVAEWNVEKPEEGRLLAKSASSVYALKLLEEQGLLVIGQNFDGIQLVDIKSRKAAGSLQLGKAAIFAIEAYGNKLFVGMGDGSLIVVDQETLKLLHHEKASHKSLRSLQIYPEKEEIAAGFSDNTIKIFNLNNYNIKSVIEAHKNSVFTLCYSPDREYLLSGSRDAHLNIWQSAAGYRKKEGIVAHMYAINHIAYSPDARYFASCSMDKSVKLWDAASFRLLKVLDKARHAGHGTSVNRLLWLNNKVLLSGSDDRTISVWDIE